MRMRMRMRMKMTMPMILSSIVIEVIRAVYYYYYYYFYEDILHKKTHKLYSNISIHLKSIIKHTSNFHSDAKQWTFAQIYA